MEGSDDPVTRPVEAARLILRPLALAGYEHQGEPEADLGAGTRVTPSKILEHFGFQSTRQTAAKFKP